MREIARIRLFCEELAGLWEKCSDMRFGQLVVNALNEDPFYVEDNDALEKIKAFVLSQGKPRYDETSPLTWKDVAYWNGCVPPPEYFEPVDPYQDIESRNGKSGLPTIDHQALGRYLKETGKKASELSREEISPFISADQPPCGSEDEKR